MQGPLELSSNFTYPNVVVRFRPLKGWDRSELRVCDARLLQLNSHVVVHVAVHFVPHIDGTDVGRVVDQLQDVEPGPNVASRFLICEF